MKQNCTIVKFTNCNEIAQFPSTKITTKLYNSRIHNLPKKYRILKFTICEKKLHNSQIHKFPKKFHNSHINELQRNYTVIKFPNWNEISKFANLKIASKSHTFWIHNLQKISQFSNSQFAKNCTIFKFANYKKLHNSQFHKL